VFGWDGFRRLEELRGPELVAGIGTGVDNLFAITVETQLNLAWILRRALGLRYPGAQLALPVREIESCQLSQCSLVSQGYSMLLVSPKRRRRI
jgi:hypothetical protein